MRKALRQKIQNVLNTNEDQNGYKYTSSQLVHQNGNQVNLKLVEFDGKILLKAVFKDNNFNKSVRLNFLAGKAAVKLFNSPLGIWPLRRDCTRLRDRRLS